MIDKSSSRDTAARRNRTYSARAVTASFMIMGLFGCAGVTNPFVTLDQPRPAEEQQSGDRTEIAGSEQKRLAQAKYGADFDTAFGYAEAAKTKYKQALVNQGRLTTWTGAGLIPLGAAATGLGLISGKSTTAAILGLTGAGILGTAYWLRNQPAQAAYLAGYEAVNCAIEAVLPLSIRRGVPDSDYERFEAARKVVGAQLANLQARIDEVERGPATDPERADLERAKEVLSAGREAQRSAVRLSLQLETAADQLVVAVDRIAAQVDRAVLNNQPDLGAISGIVGGLGSMYGQFSPVSPVGMDDQVRALDEAGRPLTLGERAETLHGAAEAVAISTNAIAVFVNAMAEAAPADKLRGCGVDPAEFAAALALDPSGPISFTAGRPETKTVIVSGGQSPYGAQIPEAPDGLVLGQPEVFGPIFTLQSTAALSAAGSYVLIVRDGAGRRKTAIVEVAPKPTPPQ